METFERRVTWRPTWRSTPGPRRAKPTLECSPGARTSGYHVHRSVAAGHSCCSGPRGRTRAPRRRLGIFQLGEWSLLRYPARGRSRRSRTSCRARASAGEEHEGRCVASVTGVRQGRRLAGFAGPDRAWLVWSRAVTIWPVRGPGSSRDAGSELHAGEAAALG